MNGSTYKSVSVLGATGSIGRQTLDVLEKQGIQAIALAAGKDVKGLEALARKFSPKVCALAEEDAARELKVRLADTDIEVVSGDAGVCRAAQMGDLAVNGIVGVSGLAPTMAAIEAGIPVALANKETLVCAGKFVMSRAAAKGLRIFPVDSEHSAIFQCLNGQNKPVRRLILTCSGGAFRGQTREQMYHYTAKEALNHPTWNMGPKITVDCASLMNKGLERIEAMRLFGVESRDVDVIIHKESIVHSMVEFEDGAILAQLGVPDMRLPIQLAITWPKRGECPGERLDLTKQTLSFAAPDYEAFPCLKLAVQAAETGESACAVLNGANEEAVRRFLKGECVFGEIAKAVEYALGKMTRRSIGSIEEALEADAEGRRLAREALTVGRRQ